jgi:hypothetical protein
MIKKLGVFFGASFLFGGILGFVPGVVTEDGMYLGIFRVNALHGILHIASGVIFICVSMLGEHAARLWFQIFGTFYAVVSVMGFVVGDGLICGVISNNQYDAWGHAGLALAMLLIGFAAPRHAAARQVGSRMPQRSSSL